MLAEYLGSGLAAALKEVQMQGEWICSKVAGRAIQWLRQTGCLCGVLDSVCLTRVALQKFQEAAFEEMNGNLRARSLGHVSRQMKLKTLKCCISC
jgi:hypothetical protein